MNNEIKYVPCPAGCFNGKQMYMACYGGRPVEEWEYCSHCKGDGEITEEEYLFMKLKGIKF